MVDERDTRASGTIRGRGAVRNVRGRFERFETVPFDDGWPGSAEDEPPRLPTTLIPDRARSIITENDSPDISFRYSINPYRGCEHGCTYCFARASHAFLGLSPGLDFETKLLYKPDAPELLRAELARPSYRPSPIALGANTDPYQPIERELGLTRRILEVLAEAQHPVSVVTKSHLVLRDIDLLAPLARRGRAAVYVSVTTLDPELARVMEPRASVPARRIRTMARLTEHGVPVGVLASPMIPALNDDELERILDAASAAGAVTANYLVLRLPHEVREVFVAWLRACFPARAERVLHRLREMHGGTLYDSTWFDRQVGRGPYAELLQRRFEIAARRLGLDRQRPSLDTSGFRRPRTNRAQGELFAEPEAP